MKHAKNISKFNKSNLYREAITINQFSTSSNNAKLLTYYFSEKKNGQFVNQLMKFTIVIEFLLHEKTKPPKNPRSSVPITSHTRLFSAKLQCHNAFGYDN